MNAIAIVTALHTAFRHMTTDAYLSYMRATDVGVRATATESGIRVVDRYPWFASSTVARRHMERYCRPALVAWRNAIARRDGLRLQQRYTESARTWTDITASERALHVQYITSFDPCI